MSSTPTVVESEVPTEVRMTQAVCYHCGENCPDRKYFLDEKFFCCQGCLSVYSLLNNAGLCNYYDLNNHAGASQRRNIREDKYAFLESEEVSNQLITFRENGQIYVNLYIPGIHCSSCIYLLENFHRLCKGVIRSDVRFLNKEVAIIFNESEVSLRQIAEHLDRIGYEPYISQGQTEKNKKPKNDRSLIYKLGVAGFCFGNIMLFSIPEYFSGSAASEPFLEGVFRYLNVLFSIPVFFYSASPFFISAWKGIRQRHLNIDVPVALAIAATFIRSLTDVFIHNGSGFFDAMTGIVFFMLAGRVLQGRTHKYLYFDRDFKDYFPMAVMVLDENNSPRATLLSDIAQGDRLAIHNNELIPADSLLLRGKSLIDYSFVTGESLPVEKRPGDLIYAGGRQLGGAIELQVVKATPASHLMQLWSKELDQEHDKKLNNRNSFVHGLARNFTFIVLSIAAFSAFYWWQHDTSKIWPAVTAILIIACPCGLLLTSTFTNGHVLRILNKNGLYLRNASIIEQFGNIGKVVFDKTGTLTSTESMTADYSGSPLTDEEKEMIVSAVRPSLHAFKHTVIALLGNQGKYEAIDFKETPGLGIEAVINGTSFKIGTAAFFSLDHSHNNQGTLIYIFKNGIERGAFILKQGLRPGLEEMLHRIKRRISIHLFSGDNAQQAGFFSKYFGENMKFRLSPVEKLSLVSMLKMSGKKVAMTGDGLNDAGALKKSDLGICISDDIRRFTPAGDAILNGENLHLLDHFIDFCRSIRWVIYLCFGISVIYNIAGLYFAVQGTLSPLIAAILMPLSTLTIVATTWIATTRNARANALKISG